MTISISLSVVPWVMSQSGEYLSMISCELPIMVLPNQGTKA